MGENRTEIFQGLPKNDYIERYDSSRWRRFDLNSGGVLILTARGQELLSYNPQLRRDVLGYKKEAKASVEAEIRKWFKAGGNSDVYSFNGRPLVVKEVSTAHSVWSALDRMDYLHGICLKFLPSYIRVPDHYGILYAPNLNRQYLLMQKVNDGLTVADLLEDEHPELNQTSKKLAIEEFNGLEEKVRQAIQNAPKAEQMPINLLPDWDPGNVIVDFDSPTKDIPFTLWIIDQ